MTQDPVNFYENEFYMFSNFSAFAVNWEWRIWMTSEHAYQAAKFDDEEIKVQILDAKSAHDAKKIARSHADSIRTDWGDVKLSVMESIVRAKLEQHPYILKKLLETGDRLIVEDSPVDAYWGIGPDGGGENQLWNIWMYLREEMASI